MNFLLTWQDMLSDTCNDGKDDDAELAERLLLGSGMKGSTAARLVLEALERASGAGASRTDSVQVCRDIISLGVESYVQMQRSVMFRELVEYVMLTKIGRRPRTIAEYRQYIRRLERMCPDFPNRFVRGIGTEDCHRVIEMCWATASTRNKARRLLHNLFEYAIRRGWCSVNPLRCVDHELIMEKRIRPLKIAQIRRLLHVLQQPEYLCCAPAVGLMLWAGIRPTEVERLRCRDVDLRNGVVSIAARHAKTGGARQVTLHPILLAWLSRTWPVRIPGRRIVPSGWGVRWRRLRAAAGLARWAPDTLRHTFASYHILRFRSLEQLQLEMGHASSELLRSRYIGLDGISQEDSALFWGTLNKLL